MLSSSAKSLAILIFGASASAANAQAFARMINFGDSLTDVGNTSSITAGLSPGSSYYNGRYSNGPVWAEDLAAQLSLPAITSSRSGGKDYATGGSRSGAGNVNASPFPFFPINLPNAGTQIESYLAASTPAADDLVTLWTGANDLLDLSFDPLVAAANVKAHAQRLVNAGVKNLLVVNLPPLGETPRYRNTANRTQMNDRATAFNNALASSLNTISAASADVTLYRADIFGLFTQALTNPAAYGFANITDTALKSDGTVVANPDQYLFYDDIHPTRVGHVTVGNYALEAVTTRTLSAVGASTPISWNAATTWTQHRVPDATSAVQLSGNATKNVVLNGDAAVRRFTLGNASAQDMTGSTTLHLTGGKLNVSSGPATLAKSGILAGAGTIGGGLDIGAGATLGPGEGTAGPSAIGQIAITGGLSLAGGALRLDLADAASDAVAVQGPATLNGTLDIRFVDGFIGLPGKVATLLTYTSAMGAPTVSNDTGYAGLTIVPSMNATAFTIRLSATGGDANLDAHVDFADLVGLAQHYGLSAGQTWLTGDFTGDAAVNFDDLVILAQQYNSNVFAADWTLAQSLVPEPTSCSVLSMLMLLARRRRPATSGI